MCRPSASDAAAALRRLTRDYATISDREIRACLHLLSKADKPVWDEHRRRWVVTRYAHAARLLGSADLDNDLADAAPDSNSIALATRLGESSRSLLFLGGAAHTGLRRTFIPWFSSARLGSVVAEFHARFAENLRRAREESSYLLGADVAHPCLLAAAIDLLGLNPEAGSLGDELIGNLFEVNRLFDLSLSAAEVARAREASRKVRAWIEISLGAGDRSGQLSASYVASIEFMLRAAVVTTGSALMRALHVCHQEQNFDSNEERVAQLLVRCSPTFETGRVVREPLDIAGVTLPRGATVIVLIAAANLDRAAADAAHLVFGFGIHRCLAERLVTGEVAAAIRAFSALRHSKTAFEPEVHRTPSFFGWRDVRCSITA